MNSSNTNIFSPLSIKVISMAPTVVVYPDFTKPFEIYTDTSTMQFGAVVIQKNRPFAFFSRKLSKVQTRYSITKN
jgi:hypothetical protein